MPCARFAAGRFRTPAKWLELPSHHVWLEDHQIENREDVSEGGPAEDKPVPQIAVIFTGQRRAGGEAVPRSLCPRDATNSIRF